MLPLFSVLYNVAVLPQLHWLLLVFFLGRRDDNPWWKVPRILLFGSKGMFFSCSYGDLTDNILVASFLAKLPLTVAI